MSSRILSAFAILPVLLSLAAAAQDAPPVPDNAVAQGTVVLIQLTDRLDTHNVRAGDHFHARLAEPLTATNGIAIPAGHKIKGHISAVQPGLHTRILLSF